jgi:hypothetical protein
MDLTEKQTATLKFLGTTGTVTFNAAVAFTAGWDAAITSALEKIAAFLGKMELDHGVELKKVVANRVPSKAVAILIDGLKLVETKEFYTDEEANTQLRIMAEKALADYFKAVGEEPS